MQAGKRNLGGPRVWRRWEVEERERDTQADCPSDLKNARAHALGSGFPHVNDGQPATVLSLMAGVGRGHPACRK